MSTPQQYPNPGQRFMTSSPANPQPYNPNLEGPDTITQGIGPGGMIPPGQPKPQRVKDKRFGWLALIITFVIGCAIGFAVGSQPVEQESGAFTQGTGYHSQEAEPTAPPESGHTDPADPVSPKPQAKVTRAQKEALESAESYLDSGHFSKKGLLDQLTSKYGEDFDKADAQWALAHVDADYKAEAVEAAESYLESGHFSKRELRSQLTSEYGEGFTKAEADYAVAQVY